MKFSAATLQLETKQFNINIVVLEPGSIATEFGDVLYNPMVENSKNTPYEPMTNLLAKAIKDNFKVRMQFLLSNISIQ